MSLDSLILPEGPYAQLRRQMYSVSLGPGAVCTGKLRPCPNVIFYLCVKSTRLGRHPANFDLNPLYDLHTGHTVHSLPVSSGDCRGATGSWGGCEWRSGHIYICTICLVRNGPRDPLLGPGSFSFPGTMGCWVSYVSISLLAPQ